MTRVDAYKLVHWLNARKLTPPLLAARCGIDVADLQGVLAGSNDVMSPAALQALASALRVDASELQADATWPDVLIASWHDMTATRRTIPRDGIDFYNYYTLPTPPGLIAPVILDILCPKDRIPALNNGHLEPAITVNLGPGPIHGRWGAELNDATWSVLAAAGDGAGEWIVGDSYIEPSYCPHTYSLASDVPAQIVSYTSKSHLAPLLARTNRAGDAVFQDLLARWDGSAARTLRNQLERRGYDEETFARVFGTTVDAVAASDEGAPRYADLQRIATRLGIDYRVLLTPCDTRDSIGRTWCTIAESRATQRRFKSYDVASTACSANTPDLVGLFCRVAAPPDREALDLQDCGCSHYLVTRGSAVFRWRSGSGAVHARQLERGSCVWVAPLTAHGFAGTAALLKLGGGEYCTYLDQLDMTNAFHLTQTLRRARKDLSGWGYDDSSRGPRAGDGGHGHPLQREVDGRPRCP